MDNSINRVGEGLNGWEDDDSDTKRCSIFTQHLILAEKISKHQHLTPRAPMFRDEDGNSFHSAESNLPSNKHVADLTAAEADTAFDKCCPPTNVRATSTRRTRKPRQSSRPPLGEWTWTPSVPHRTSSMSTRRRTGKGTHRPDLATFHRRSCQLFTSLDSTLSNATSTTSNSCRTSTSTSPSLASSVTTQATSIPDDILRARPALPTFHSELQDPRSSSQRSNKTSFDHPGLGRRRSSSRLSPKVTCTEQVFWTSEASRQAEYAKIDASYHGFKGFVKKCLPRQWAWAHGKRRKFHEQMSSTAGACQSPQLEDDDSVRRYRISIGSAAQEAIRSVEMHGVSRAATPASLNLDVADPQINLEAEHVGGNPNKATPVKKVLTNVRPSKGLARLFRGRTSKA